MGSIRRVVWSESDKRIRLGFYGVLGSGNIGNDGSLDAVVQHIRATHPEAQLRFFVMGPERLRDRYDAPAAHLQWFEAHVARLQWVPSVLLKIVGRMLDPVRTLYWVLQQDVVVVPGMGVLEATIPVRPWGLPYGLLALVVAGRLTGRPVLLVGVGADMIHQRLTRWIITQAARIAHYRSYRDENSRRAMCRMGVDVSADEVFPDLAFAHTIPARAPDGSRAVGLGLMNYIGTNNDRARATVLRRSYIDAMTRFAIWLVDEGRPLRLYTCDPIDASVVSAVMDGVHAQRPDLPSAMVAAEPVTDLHELRRAVATVDAVIATRFHNVLTAVQLSVPTISIGYSRKHDDLMERMGLGAYCQAAHNVDVDRLVAQFRQLEASGPDLARTMDERSRENMHGARAQLRVVSELIFGRPEVGAAGRPPRPSRGLKAPLPRVAQR